MKDMDWVNVLCKFFHNFFYETMEKSEDEKPNFLEAYKDHRFLIYFQNFYLSVRKLATVIGSGSSHFLTSEKFHCL